MASARSCPPKTADSVQEQTRPPPFSERGRPAIPQALTEEQRQFADENHNLIYTYLWDRRLEIDGYYYIAVFGYLRAVKRYLSEPWLRRYQFSTVAWHAMGNFFNHAPVETNVYGCELDLNAYKVARYLYPQANLVHGDIRAYQPGVRFDYVVGNPPFHLRWWLEDGSEMASQLYYCVKAAELLKPMGILALIVPQSFLADLFMDGSMIRTMEKQFRFLGQVILPDNAFSAMGVNSMPTKLQFWQARGGGNATESSRYTTEAVCTLSAHFDVEREAQQIYERVLMLPKADLERNKSRILLELAHNRAASKNFAHETQKLLYQIKAHPATRSRYTRCCEYLHRFYTEKQPANMKYEEWVKRRLTEKQVLSYLRQTLRKQNQMPERDVVALVKQNDNFAYKAYSAKARSMLTNGMKTPVPVYQAVLDNDPDQYPGFEALLRRKCQEYSNQSQAFHDMPEDPEIAA